MTSIRLSGGVSPRHSGDMDTSDCLPGQDRQDDTGSGQIAGSDRRWRRPLKGPSACQKLRNGKKTRQQHSGTADFVGLRRRFQSFEDEARMEAQGTCASLPERILVFGCYIDKRSDLVLDDKRMQGTGKPQWDGIAGRADIAVPDKIISPTSVWRSSRAATARQSRAVKGEPRLSQALACARNASLTASSCIGPSPLRSLALLCQTGLAVDEGLIIKTKIAHQHTVLV